MPTHRDHHYHLVSAPKSIQAPIPTSFQHPPPPPPPPSPGVGLCLYYIPIVISITSYVVLPVQYKLQPAFKTLKIQESRIRLRSHFLVYYYFLYREVTLVKCCASVYCNCSFELHDILKKKKKKKLAFLYFLH